MNDKLLFLILDLLSIEYDITFNNFFIFFFYRNIMEMLTL